jgi:hypothetical protein
MMILPSSRITTANARRGEGKLEPAIDMDIQVGLACVVSMAHIVVNGMEVARDWL